MGYTIAEKIIKEHLLGGNMTRGEEIALKIDQTLTQDATGTMAYLEFGAMGIDRVKTELSVAYVDHNTLQSGFENADDHLFIQSAAKKYGVKYSRPGNGICHQVHLERFGIPGKTLIGSDSHTPTAGGLGMLAFGAGGLDVAVAMGGGAYHIRMPKITKINLTGRLVDFATAKDVSLELLRILTVKGGVGHVIEWGGEGVDTLSVTERATITNMGAELGATTSIFPSDRVTEDFLKAQGRGECFRELFADVDAKYDRIIDIDLSSISPMTACPSSPDNVVTVKSVAGKPINQVCIGSCTNSSLSDMLKVAAILKGNRIDDRVSLSISPGSKQVLKALADSGALSDIISSGARILECACGPCIGMGFSPNSKGISLRTFNRNFEGRSGTADAGVYLVSPETAAISAIRGVITDPADIDISLNIDMPEMFNVDDSSIIEPYTVEESKFAEIIMGPNIKPLPIADELKDKMKLKVCLKVGDNITTDHIMPAGAKILPYRSNIPRMSDYCFETVDKGFPERAKSVGACVIIGGENYGQGSSREHAALVPLYLGVRIVIAKSFARIHASNLVNAGIIPLIFADKNDYDKLELYSELEFSDIKTGLEKNEIKCIDKKSGEEIVFKCELTTRNIDILKAGGLLRYIAGGGK